MNYKIALDGPSGAGKSSLAKLVAKDLGIVYVDTGALYRTIGLFMVQNNISIDDKNSVIQSLKNISLEMDFIDGTQVILLNKNKIGDEIRTPEISMAASKVSAIQEVRDFLLNTQRNIAKTHSVIMDGRDIGTVIFPDAEIKIFLTASIEERARRRYNELLSKQMDVQYEDILKQMIERDEQDKNRAIAPAIPASDAIILDNSNMSLQDSVNFVKNIVKNKTNN